MKLLVIRRDSGDRANVCLGAGIPVILLATVVLAGCDGFETFQDASRDLDRAAELLEHKLGAKPEVGFDIFNGQLRVVNVFVDGPAVERLAVGELEDHVRSALAATLKELPGQVLISLRFTGSRPEKPQVPTS